jgi:hypothetical protein
MITPSGILEKVEPPSGATKDGRNRVSERRFLFHLSAPPFPPHFIPRKMLILASNHVQGGQIIASSEECELR